MTNDVQMFERRGGKSDFLYKLRVTNAARNAEWENGQPVGALFHATELGGECGEVLNKVKKLERARMGLRGSRSSTAELADEIGDVLICLDKIAAQYGIDLADATARKFNRTSSDNGFSYFLPEGEEA